MSEGSEVNIRDDALANRAPPKPPKGVTFPTREPEARALRFGFVENAERWNSRAAMVRCLLTALLVLSMGCWLSTCLLQIGFISLLILEAVANRGILDMMGIRVGGGLGVEL